MIFFHGRSKRRLAPVFCTQYGEKNELSCVVRRARGDYEKKFYSVVRMPSAVSRAVKRV